MGLQIIYGKAGTGKSKYCFDKIKEEVEKESKVYMITPEQFSFTQEKKLLETFEEGAVIDAEVLTFKRMAYRVNTEVGGLTKTNLSKAGKAMLISHILQQEKKNLTFLGRNDENIEVMDNQIRELKKHMISVEALKNAIDNIQNPYLKLKLEDIYKVYSLYESSIKEQYIDEDDILTILVNKLEETDLFNNSVIFIDEFNGFTKQEYEIIRKLLKVAKKVYITICADDYIKTDDETNLFYANRQTIDYFYKIAKEEKVAVEEPVKLSNTYRFKNEELANLEKYLSNTSYEIYKKDVENISLFLAKNPFSEIEEVAKSIIELVKNNYLYRDIAVIVKDLDTYESIIRAVFARFEIPVFIDQKKSLSQNIFVKYILSVLEIFRKNWSNEAMFYYLKMGFTNIEDKDIFELENYCTKYGIRGRKWYDEDFKVAESDEKLEYFNNLRKKIVYPLLKLKNECSKGKNVENLSKAIYEFLIENEIDKLVDEKSKELEKIGMLELANNYQTAWNTVIDVLDEMVYVLKNEKLSFDEYEKLLKTGLENSPLGAIPATLDQVIVGDVERSRTHKVKMCFIVGLNDGVFPAAMKEEGFLSDDDRNILKEQKLELAKTTLEQLYDENFNIYKAFLVAEEKLFLSYPSCDQQGKSLRPSSLIFKIKKAYPNLKEKSDMVKENDKITTKEATFYELLNSIQELKDGKEIDPIWYSVYLSYAKDSAYKKRLEEALKGMYYKNTPDKISKENIEKLYTNTLHTSISRLEQFKSCGFSFYLKYGLGLKNKDLYEIKNLDTGNLMHDMIDGFFDQVLQRKLVLKEMTWEEIEEIIHNLFNEKLTLNRNYIFTSNKRFNVLTRRLEKVVLKSMKYIIETILDSDFDILGNEVEFQKNADFPPIQIELEDGKKVELTGKIDRIDLAKGKDGNYVRIIDYKSSVKNIELNEVMAGLQIQLLTYLDAVCEKKDFMPAGVLYFNLIDPIVKADKNKTDEEIEEEIRKQFKMQGLILADIHVVRMMDKKLDQGASKLIPAYIDKDDNLSKTKSSAVTKEQFKDLQKQMKKIIKEIAKEIYSGDISIKPYYNAKKKTSPCDYCDYRSICNFNPTRNSYYYIPQKEKEEILSEIKGD